jgi:hypothetical protein
MNVSGVYGKSSINSAAALLILLVLTLDSMLKLLHWKLLDKSLKSVLLLHGRLLLLICCKSWRQKRLRRKPQRIKRPRRKRVKLGRRIKELEMLVLVVEIKRMQIVVVMILLLGLLLKRRRRKMVLVVVVRKKVARKSLTLN